MAYTVQNLEHAVCVFYSSEHSERAEAHKWLTAAQRCPEAWSFVWELLQSQKGTEIQFFAATTLHAKLQRYWAEVPPDNYEELKNRILEAIAMFSRGPKIVLNRLCISLAAFLLQQGGKGLIEAIERLLSPDWATILLELLTVVPEEFNSMTMTANNRSTVRYNLQQLTPQVLELVIKHLQVDSISSGRLSEDDWSKQVAIWQGACQCAGAWLHLGGALPADCVPIVTSVLQVLHAVYWGQSHGQPEGQRELSGAELETCEAALSAVSAALTQPEAGRHSASCRPLLRLLLDAAEPLLLTEDVIHTANEELVAVLYGALVAAGECHARWAVLAITEDEVFGKITSKNNESENDEKNRKESALCARDLVRLILRCSAAAGTYPMQETHSQLAFGFWFILQDEAIWEIPERLGETSNVKNALRCWYEQLAAALLRKSSLPVSPPTPSAEDVELIRCYRQDVADTLLYCHAVLGDSLVTQLATLLEDLKGNESSDGGCALEAVLHAFLALAEAATPQTSQSLLSLMRTLIDLPYDRLHQQVLMTALDCFGTYAEWLGSVEEGGAAEVIVGGALSVAGRALSRSGAAPRAALALRALCRDCRPHLAPHAHHLLQAVQAGQGRWAGAVDVQVLGAAGGAAASLSPSVAAPYLISLTNPLVLALQSARQPQLSKNEESECIAALRQAGSLLSPLSGDNVNVGDKMSSSGVELVRIPLSLLLPVLPHAAHHSELAEPLFFLIKMLITNLLDGCIPLVPEFINMVNINLQADPHPAAIDVAKLISLMFPDISGGTLNSVASAVLNICSEGHSQGQTLSTHAPILDYFYSALTAVATKRPLLLQQLELQMQNIVQLGILTMSLPEQAPCRAGCWFFSRLAKARPADLLPQAPAIVQRSIHCIGVSTPRANIDNFAELFLGFIRAQWEEATPGRSHPVTGPAQLSMWLKDALQHNGFPSNNATPEVKDKFIKAIVRCQDHKRRIIEAIREFALASRGLVGEYGQMTQPLNSY